MERPRLVDGVAPQPWDVEAECRSSSGNPQYPRASARNCEPESPASHIMMRVAADLGTVGTATVLPRSLGRTGSRL